MDTPGQNDQSTSFSAQKVIDDYLSRNPIKDGLKDIEDKFSYELQSAGCEEPKNKLKAGVDLFIGTLKENGSHCVIRRYDTKDRDPQNFMRDLKALKTPAKFHENFIRYFGNVEVGAHTYYAVELCRYSVEELISNANTETLYAHVWKTFSREMIMHQTALGLDYLHGLEGGFIHRNIHGRNVLVAEIPTSSDKHYVVKLSDFRFGKPAQKDPKNSLTKSESGWIAPEMNDPEAMLGPWTDVYILGCFFHYVLSGGNHPFGCNTDNPNRKTNIINGKYSSKCWNAEEFATFWKDDSKKKFEFEFTKLLNDDYKNKFTNLIRNMTKHAGGERTNLSRVLQFFQRDAANFPLYKNTNEVKPGLCVIINQQEFPEISTNFRILKPEVRHGSEKDAEALFDTFTGFGYDVRICNNLKAEQLRQTLKNLAKEKDPMGQSIFKRYASLVVCLLSHGSLGTVLGIDRQPVNVLELQYEMFNSETCPDLNDKPKIFIIQACQGEVGQRMILCDPTINDDVLRKNLNACSPELHLKLNVNPPLEGSQPQPEPNKPNKIKAQFRDIITLWSTIEGFVSLRDGTHGSVFIQSLCKQLKDFGGDNVRDLYEAHLNVTQDVTDDMIAVSFRFPQPDGTQQEPGDQATTYYVNQTPLYKSTAYRKVAFQKINELKI